MTSHEKVDPQAAKVAMALHDNKFYGQHKKNIYFTFCIVYIYNIEKYKSERR